jgi:tetratricopeptide (TPR) repeat protein
MEDRLLTALEARLRRFAESGVQSAVLDPVALDQADELWQAAQPSGNDPRALPVEVLTVIAYLHLARFQALPEGQDQDDLRKALGLFSALMEQAPERVPDHIRSFLERSQQLHPGDAQRLTIQGANAWDEYRRTGSLEALNTAVVAFRDAVGATPLDHPNRATMLSNLAASLGDRFGCVGDSADLDAAVEAAREAVDAILPGDSNLASYLSNLGNALLARYELAGDSVDLDAAVDAGYRAVDTTLPSHPKLAMYLSSLGNSLLTRFEQYHDRQDLDDAIDAGHRSVDTTPSGDPNLASYLSNLGNALLARYELAGDAADLETAIAAGHRAVDTTPLSHPNLTAYLWSLGNSLLARYEHAGDAEDLDAAVDAGKRAVKLTSPGNPRRAMYLSNLGAWLGTRFERSGDRADMDAAVDAGHRAVDTTPPGDSNLASYLSNLGNTLLTRFEQYHDRQDLDAAIDVGRQAVNATPVGHPNLPASLSSLGASLGTRFEQYNDRQDLDDAIEASRRAVNAAPDHPELGAYLANLGAAMYTRYKQDGDLNDLEAAIGIGRRAVEATPVDHPALAMHLSNLGNALCTRFEQNGDAAELDSAVSRWQQASQLPTGTPRVRLAAARTWGVRTADAGRTHAAADGYAAAVKLLPEVAWHGLDRATREEQLAQWSGLAADAAACAILDGCSESAVELLEQGRSVLWSQALNLRTDLTRLTELYPHLAEQLDSIRTTLDTSVPKVSQSALETAGVNSPSVGSTRQQQDAVELRRRKAREWDQVLAQVRALEGFEHFLEATPYAELTTAAVGGPVVVVNASRHGCHALIIHADSEQVQVVCLPDMTPDAVVGHANAMLTALAGATERGRPDRQREKDRHAILDVLDWLWDTVAGPVLTALGHTGPHDEGQPWPKVWWCPTGPLTILPIHAAGHHPRLRTASTVARSDCVLDRVISSYTPTLTALARARQTSEPSVVRHLTVGMPATPRQRPLPAVPQEMEVLARHFPPSQDNHQLTGSAAIRDAVQAAITDHSWLHFACHARQHHADPDRSGFALWDGTLTINDLAAQPTQHHDLAFLSACQTATGSTRHLDEAIHLASAMQFLGYRSVIATMWIVADSPAPYIANEFYTPLASGGPADPGRSAEALHRAVRSLRQVDPTNPLLWAPYIHLGP